MHILFCPVSYNNQKVRLRWNDAGVTINPELKLLQYHMGEPLRLDETDAYMVEKDGMLTFNRFKNNIFGI